MHRRSLRNSQRQRERESGMMLSEVIMILVLFHLRALPDQRFLPKLCSNLSQRGIAKAYQLQSLC
ncbi:MAG: hypothetical protein IRD3MM_02620 [Candidatus Midichloria mitochondrii]